MLGVYWISPGYLLDGHLLDIYWLYIYLISTHGIVRVSTKCYLKARATLWLCSVQFSFLSAFPVLAVLCVAGLGQAAVRPYLEIFVHKSGLLHYRCTPPAPPTATATSTHIGNFTWDHGGVGGEIQKINHQV